MLTELGHAIMDAAKSRGVSGERLSRALGLSRSALYSRLRDDSRWRVGEAAMVSKLLNIPLANFFNEEEK